MTEEYDPAVIASIQQSQNGYSMQGRQVSDSVSTLEIDTTDILAQIERFLRGQVWDPEEKAYFKKYPQMASDQEITEILVRIFAKSNRTFLLSNFDMTEIKTIAYETGHEINKYLLTKLLLDKNTGVKAVHYKFIVQMIDHITLASLKRALNGEERLHRERWMNVVEHRLQREGQGKKSPVGAFKMMKNKMQGEGDD